VKGLMQTYTYCKSITQSVDVGTIKFFKGVHPTSVAVVWLGQAMALGQLGSKWKAELA